MIEQWFTDKCMALVGTNGRALSGEALEKAEQLLSSVRSSGCKVWTDRNGVFYCRERKLFAAARMLTDEKGNPLRICGRLVKSKANFCSKCGSPAPGSWWRCGGCGRLIGSESETCPHCGREQNPMMRLDISDGSWRKDEEVFAERFEMPDVAPLMTKGLNIQESQCAILLLGGKVRKVIGAGFHPAGEVFQEEGEIADQSLVMVDHSEFSLAVGVDDVRTAEDMKCSVHAVFVLKFSPDHAAEFMANLMGGSLFLKNDALTSSLGYDEIAHCLLADVDAAARLFCGTVSAADLFKDADIRMKLEDRISEVAGKNLGSAGIAFIRLKELEFESPVFEDLREKAGQVEAKRREIEFMKRADELANDAVRREALNEFEMEDYINQLAHEKGIKEELRVQELERMRGRWKQQQEYDQLSHENDLDDLQQARQRERDRIDAEFEQDELDLRQQRELERKIAEQKSSLEYMQIENRIADIRLEMDKKQAAAEQEAAANWLKIKQQKKSFDQEQKIELVKALAGAGIRELLAAEDDPEKRRDLLALYEQEMQASMTPELLLAAAAARGNAAAAEALSRMSREQQQAVENAAKENKELFNQILQMNERMFSQAMENMAKGSAAAPTTQIIK